MRLPGVASHSRTVLSPLPEAMRLPSGLNATLTTVPGVAGQRVADRLAGVRVPQPHGLVALRSRGTRGDHRRSLNADLTPVRVAVSGRASGAIGSVRTDLDVVDVG